MSVCLIIRKSEFTIGRKMGVFFGYSAILFLLCLVSFAAPARMVSLAAGQNIAIEAEYRPGDPTRPLILFVHGFLQTRDFSTVRRLSDALSDNGYSTLSPNLSLGISRRQRSVSCESIQLHSLPDAAREIGLWVDWAARHGHRRIVLLGHSAGSVMVTAYLASRSDSAVDQTILISLDYFGPGRPAAFETVAHGLNAQRMLERDDDSLATFALSFCKQYVTNAERYLSYFNWNQERVLSAIQGGSVDNHVIFGSRDKRIGKAWVDDLAAQHALVHVIDGANHFFDQTYEFELLDTVENILQDH